MLLGIPGDNTYSNYQEAQRAFWRQTVLPLVNRTARALSSWLAPAFEPRPALGGRLPSSFALGDSAPRSRPPSALEFKPDLDQIEALAPERDALWKRLEAASFLTTDEKRAAAGYDAEPDSAVPQLKYREDQPRVPVGQSGGGQWTDGGGGGLTSNDGRVRVAQAAERSGYPVDILEEDKLGGHTIERHVGKPEEYLKARILGNRTNIPLIGGYGEKRAGPFTSVETANKLVNSVISEPRNRQKIENFVGGGFGYLLPDIFLYPAKPFGSTTGYEAFSPDERSTPIMRSTNSVEVRIRRTNSSPKGYYVYTAFPLNED
jgi:hypothetical protein